MHDKKNKYVLINLIYDGLVGGKQLLLDHVKYSTKCGPGYYTICTAVNFYYFN